MPPKKSKTFQGEFHVKFKYKETDPALTNQQVKKAIKSAILTNINGKDESISMSVKKSSIIFTTKKK